MTTESQTKTAPVAGWWRAWLLGIALVLLATFPAGARAADEDWAEELAGLEEGDWRGAFALGQRLAALPPDEGFAILKENWSKIGPTQARQQMLKAWSFAAGRDLDHSRLLDVVDLCMRDPDKEVRTWGERILPELTFKDFSADAAGYAAWHEANQGQSLNEVGVASMRQLVAELDQADPMTALERATFAATFGQRMLRESPEVRQAARDSGLPKIVERWAADALADSDLTKIQLTKQGMRLLARIEIPEEELKTILTPILERGVPDEIRATAIETLNRKDSPWALEQLVRLMCEGAEEMKATGRPSLLVMAAAPRLAEAGDPRTIPILIGIIASDDTETTGYWVGYFGLARLTGVKYDKSHDAAWWQKWWEEHKQDYPPEVRAMEIPDLAQAKPIELPKSDASVSPAKIAWLKQHALAVRSIDPADDDFADLAPLAGLIGDARVVALGEETHGDGAAFYAKARLIRFLHEKLGFDVVAWESGLLDCRLADEALGGEQSAVEAGRVGVFGIWMAGGQVAPVFEYLKATKTTKSPITLCGFDCQFSALGPKPVQDFIFDFFGTLEPEILTTGDLDQIDALVDRLTGREEDSAATDRQNAIERARKAIENNPDDKEKVRELEELLSGGEGDRTAAAPQLAAVERALKSLANNPEAVAAAKTAKEVDFMRAVLNNLIAFDKTRRVRPNAPEAGNVRDAAMAENLVWLANDYYQGHKIIVWAASFHLVHDAPGIVAVDGKLDYSKTVPMGHIVKEKLGDALYTIAFTAHSGHAGNPFYPPFALRPAGGSLEDLLHQAGFANAIVDLRSLPKAQGGVWLAEPLVARPLGYTDMRARWPGHFDAMFYNDVMFPSTRDGAVPAGVKVGAK